MVPWERSICPSHVTVSRLPTVALCLRNKHVPGGIAKAGEPNNISPLAPGMTYLDPAIHATLRRKQRRLAREHEGVLAAIAKGANLAINECQHQFRTRRWNCSTRNFQRGKNLFGKIVERDSSATDGKRT
uniref:Protein Wnt n=1 Tax=Anopheles minimus TaxID=112268 RepID=A0A182WGH7_9DIPT